MQRRMFFPSLKFFFSQNPPTNQSISQHFLWLEDGRAAARENVSCLIGVRDFLSWWSVRGFDGPTVGIWLVNRWDTNVTPPPFPFLLASTILIRCIVSGMAVAMLLDTASAISQNKMSKRKGTTCDSFSKENSFLSRSSFPTGGSTH